jgi:hypothetical protein
MTLNIEAHTDYNPDNPALVRFYIDRHDNNVAWQGALEVGNWLNENKIEHTIIAFSDERISAVIPSEEARVLIRLTYEMHIVVYYDEDTAWF